jgi:hypothetical protein
MMALGPQIERSAVPPLNSAGLVKRYAKWIAGAAQAACCEGIAASQLHDVRY